MLDAPFGPAMHSRYVTLDECQDLIWDRADNRRFLRVEHHLNPIYGLATTNVGQITSSAGHGVAAATGNSVTQGGQYVGIDGEHFDVTTGQSVDTGGH
jgi:hypothetical protein